MAAKSCQMMHVISANDVSSVLFYVQYINHFVYKVNV